MTRVFFREAVACIITYEVELPSSFESSQSWKEDLDAKVRLPNGDRIPTVLLGNKVSQAMMMMMVVTVTMTMMIIIVTMMMTTAAITMVMRTIMMVMATVMLKTMTM